MHSSKLLNAVSTLQYVGSRSSIPNQPHPAPPPYLHTPTCCLSLHPQPTLSLQSLSPPVPLPCCTHPPQTGTQAYMQAKEGVFEQWIEECEDQQTGKKLISPNRRNTMELERGMPVHMVQIGKVPLARPSSTPLSSRDCPDPSRMPRSSPSPDPPQARILPKPGSSPSPDPLQARILPKPRSSPSPDLPHPSRY